MNAAGGGGAGHMKTTKQVYRDCLRLIQHMAGNSPKADVLRNVVRTQFKQNMNETNEAAIQQLKGRAERVLSQYLFYEQSTRDPRFKDHLQQQAEQQMLNQNPEIAQNEELYEQEKKRIKHQMSSMGAINTTNIAQFLDKEWEAVTNLSEDEIRRLEEQGVLEEEEEDSDTEESIEDDLDKYIADADSDSSEEENDTREKRQ
eukprot:gb/GECG01012602.1/.p1 GENE.gb/GECG01012602.1/~~gb/GECG01012602.1/.p1  ORF type:complete len:202 (+),score=48.07 gb/GECG01012602.1/:1-606(+)